MYLLSDDLTHITINNFSAARSPNETHISVSGWIQNDGFFKYILICVRIYSI